MLASPARSTAAARGYAAPARCSSTARRCAPAPPRSAPLPGGAITTIEGLARDGELHPVQQAFVDENGDAVRLLHPGIHHDVGGAARPRRPSRPRRRSARRWRRTCAAAAPTSASSPPSKSVARRRAASLMTGDASEPGLHITGERRASAFRRRAPATRRGAYANTSPRRRQRAGSPCGPTAASSPTPARSSTDRASAPDSRSRSPTNCACRSTRVEVVLGDTGSRAMGHGHVRQPVDRARRPAAPEGRRHRPRGAARSRRRPPRPARRRPHAPRAAASPRRATPAAASRYAELLAGRSSTRDSRTMRRSRRPPSSP